MIGNNIASTVRYFRNNKSFLIINLIGLMTALTACYFALVYVTFELGYDSYHRNFENIYRVVVDAKTSNGVDYRGTSLPLAPAVKEAFPEVEATTRIFLDYLIFQNDAGVQSEEKIAYADSTIFSVFSFDLIHGLKDEVLNTPFQLVLTESTANKYFGVDDPIGKTLLINGKDAAYVSGIIKDIPFNSHFRVDIFVSMSTLVKVLDPRMETNWKSRRTSTYLVLQPGTNPDYLNEKITRLLKTKIDEPGIEYLTALEPLRSVYLYGKPRGSRSGSIVTGNIINLYVCSIVSILVIIIASLNYVNLATAFSIQRAKEIGVRKMLGASRFQLAIQFLSDAVILSFLAFVASCGLIALLIPLFNQISGKVIAAGILEYPAALGVLFIIALLTGALSGLYPAIFLSGLQPVKSLKGRFVSTGHGIKLRRILVVNQFLASFVLITGTIVMYRQLDFMQNRQLGFRKDHMLAIDFQFDKSAGNEYVKRQLVSLPGVLSGSLSSSLPGRASMKLETMIENSHDMEELSNLDAYFVDYSFLDQYGIKVIAGRAFSQLISSDSTEAMIVNESAVKYLGYARPDDIIGKRFLQAGRTGVIIGVVEDFHFQSFHEVVQPLTIQAGGFETFMTLSLSSKNLSTTISEIEKKWKSVVPNMPLLYFFTDDAYDSQYVTEQRFGKVFLCMASIAIILSCLGLIGLSVFSTTQRTKEIGIRKVLGSSSLGIVWLLSYDFLVLIGIGIMLGIPVSWFTMNNWLEGFAYRIDIGTLSFFSSAIILLAIALSTIALQTIKTANADPIRSLKSE